MNRRTIHPRRRRADTGSASVELVILFPAVLLIITALLQYGLWFHARALALAAAQEGVFAARNYHSTPNLGAATALAFIADHGSDTLLSPAATTSTPTLGQVQVAVTGRSLSVLPGVAGLVVSQSAAGPLEQFTVAGAP